MSDSFGPDWPDRGGPSPRSNEAIPHLMSPDTPPSTEERSVQCIHSAPECPTFEDEGTGGDIEKGTSPPVSSSGRSTAACSTTDVSSRATEVMEQRESQIVAAATAAAVAAVSSANIGQEPRSKSSKPSLHIDTSSVKMKDTWESYPGNKKKIETYRLDTPSTVAMSPSSDAASPTETFHKVEHQHTYKRSRQSKYLAMSKPLVGIAGIVVLALAGGSAYLLTDWFGLNAQIEELTLQVDRLEAQVDRLSEENDRFAALNDRLEKENEVFAEEIQRFEESNALYASLNQELAGLNEENARLNQMLNESNAEYEKLNIQLAATKDDFTEQVEELQKANDDVEKQVSLYMDQNRVLSLEVDRLEYLNGDLSEQLGVMNSTIGDFRSENDRLSKLNDDLQIVVSYLDETAGSIQDTYDEFVANLAEQITAGRSIWTASIQNIYRMRTASLVCDLQSRFSDEPFVTDANLPIGSVSYPEVIGYVEEHILSELCLDTADFETFLASDSGATSVPPVNVVALNDLVRGLTRYNRKAMDFYFSGSRTAGGLNIMDWASAQYRCENLPPEKRFLISQEESPAARTNLFSR